MNSVWTEASDVSLVVAVGRYDQSALAEIYRRHGGPVNNLALRVLQDRQLADDVTQEVFVAFWKDPQRYDAERASLRSWLLLKAHGKAVDMVRAEQARRRRDDVRINDRVFGNEMIERYDLDREIWDIAVAERVQVALADLGEAERKAITLAYFGGHSYRTVASMLGEAEGTTKSRIRNGLKTMRRRLSDLDDATTTTTTTTTNDASKETTREFSNETTNETTNDDVGTRREAAQEGDA